MKDKILGILMIIVLGLGYNGTIEGLPREGYNKLFPKPIVYGEQRLENILKEFAEIQKDIIRLLMMTLIKN